MPAWPCASPASPATTVTTRPPRTPPPSRSFSTSPTWPTPPRPGSAPRTPAAGERSLASLKRQDVPPDRRRHPHRPTRLEALAGQHEPAQPLEICRQPGERASVAVAFAVVVGGAGGQQAAGLVQVAGQGVVGGGGVGDAGLQPA